MQVVGIAPGLRQTLFDQAPTPHLYVPYGNHYRSGMHLHARVARAGRTGRGGRTRDAPTELRSVDDRVPVLELTSMQGFQIAALGCGASGWAAAC